MASRENVRDEEPATSITRTQKLVSKKFNPLQVRPHRLEDVPRTYVVLVVVNVDVDFAVVHVVPPSHESWTQSFGEFKMLSTFPVS